MLPRSVEIQNRHPRLTVPAAAVRRAIGLLDERFQVLPADLKTFAPARARAVRASAGPADRRSKIPPGGCPAGELSIVFLTDSALARLHDDFLDDPTTTDVITFEGHLEAGLAGEICVSADMARTYAGEHRRGFAPELTLYLVHGWLHLAGYDDLQPAKKRRMRAAEARAMKILTEADAVPAFRLR